MIGRLFILSAFPAMWLSGSCSFLASVCWALGAFAFLLVIDSGRGIRTLPSTIVARFMFAIAMFVFFLFYLLGNHAAGRMYWTLADCLVVPFWVTVIVATLFWTCLYFGTLLFRNDLGYQQWARAGGHYFWDTLPRILNRDSELVRNGGFAEPTYTDFIPPTHFQNQCPKCGARVQHAFGVCWNCNYGADGDATAFYERYGR
ncbi:hypothetical protein [Rubripirellula reticaptiva]|uniref:Uncharacterized protein n=1 Tax=Rubripirellula reticaptiva TaxID=2528013 RepID=A0A5C6EHK7_9BACT|nr:hypothetical protein [Rubripirellula reticaptiva]TWU49263.1 hypothetical protein Poly59_38770 [Rubripirellula reticaptiva]